jgi:C1A family cysteine protease
MTDSERLTNLEAQIKTINDALQSKGIISSATSKGKRLYGFKPDLPDQRDYAFEDLKLKISLPQVVDLRAVDSPIEDQGNLGSCTSNALAGAIQFLETKDKVKPAPANMSRLFIYYNERVIENTVNSDSGAALRDGIKTLATQGCCPEVEWPYVISKFEQKPHPICYTTALTHVIQSYYRVNTLSDMQTCLASGFPFVFGFTVYESFESDQVAATGIVPMPAANEQVLGGHAVMAVGYDMTSQRFIVRNSWGKNWGLKGYFTIPFAYLTNPNLASDMWYISKQKGF